MSCHRKCPGIIITGAAAGNGAALLGGGGSGTTGTVEGVGGGGAKNDFCNVSNNGKPSPAEAARITRRDIRVRTTVGGIAGAVLGGIRGGFLGAIVGYGSVGLQRASNLYPGGLWDPRNSVAGIRIYGAVTAALGVPREVALRASGFIEQHGKESNNPYNKENGTYSDPSGNFGNRPETIKAIDEGRQCAA